MSAKDHESRTLSRCRNFRKHLKLPQKISSCQPYLRSVATTNNENTCGQIIISTSIEKIGAFHNLPPTTVAKNGAQREDQPLNINYCSKKGGRVRGERIAKANPFYGFDWKLTALELPPSSLHSSSPLLSSQGRRA
jgi:hypothetical protein